jgi:uncharacterized Ntn-hydrolase superfamily protein
MARDPIVATYSIAACDLDAKQWGVAVQSKFLSVGSVVPWAEPEVGAIATQAYANPRYGPNGLALLRDGLSAAEVVERLTSEDDGRAERQLGIVDGEGRSASWTGPECLDWAGHLNGPCYAAQGNILVGAETVDALAATFEANASLPLAPRLLDCLAAAQAAGGKPDRGTAPHLRPPPAPVRLDPARGVAAARRRAPRRSGREARAPRLRHARRLGGSREPRGAGRRR